MTEYPQPNFTMLPNLLLDEDMLTMSESELKVTLAIARETFGWHRGNIPLSYTELEGLTGLKRPSVIKGVKEGVERGRIIKETQGQGNKNLYSLNVIGSKKSLPEVVKDFNYPQGKPEGAEINKDKENIESDDSIFIGPNGPIDETSDLTISPDESVATETLSPAGDAPLAQGDSKRERKQKPKKKPHKHWLYPLAEYALGRDRSDPRVKAMIPRLSRLAMWLAGNPITMTVGVETTTYDPPPWELIPDDLPAFRKHWLSEHKGAEPPIHESKFIPSFIGWKSDRIRRRAEQEDIQRRAAIALADAEEHREEDREAYLKLARALCR